MSLSVSAVCVSVYTLVFVYTCLSWRVLCGVLCIGVCVCVREREREKTSEGRAFEGEGERGRGGVHSGKEG